MIVIDIAIYISIKATFDDNATIAFSTAHVFCLLLHKNVLSCTF